MNIAQSIIEGQTPPNDHLFYLLWLALVELQNNGIDIVGTFDPDETYCASDLLEVLDEKLGVMP